jgi:hypothetical protein
LISELITELVEESAKLKPEEEQSDEEQYQTEDTK